PHPRRPHLRRTHAPLRLPPPVRILDPVLGTVDTLEPVAAFGTGGPVDTDQALGTGEDVRPVGAVAPPSGAAGVRRTVRPLRPRHRPTHPRRVRTGPRPVHLPGRRTGRHPRLRPP